jgi:hypothetical protein
MSGIPGASFGFASKISLIFVHFLDPNPKDSFKFPRSKITHHRVLPPAFNTNITQSPLSASKFDSLSQAFA